VRQSSPNKYVVKFSQPIPEGVGEVFLRVDYDGDTGMAFIDGRLVADHFNNGSPWTIGLKRFQQQLLAGEMCLVFRPVRKGLLRNTSSTLAGRSDFEGEELLAVNSLTATLEYYTRLSR
jgi:hypothetical protein